MQKREVIGIGSLALTVLGWMGIGLVAVLFPGGHPPLLAYVLVPVVVGLIPINVLGLVLTRYIRRENGPMRMFVGWGNLISLAIGFTVVLCAIVISLRVGGG